MSETFLSRRRFLLASAAGLAAGARRAAGAGRPMRLGGPIFEQSDDPAALAKAHRKLGYRAAYCPAVKLEDRERIAAIVKAFAAEDVAIAEVGAWVNMLDPDAEKRRANLSTVTERLAVAEAVGARCCVDIAGSYNPKVWYGPNPKNLTREFLDATVENCRRVIDAVKPARTRLTIEMMPWNLPDGPDPYLELIKAVDRKAFAVHLDVCNVINSPTRFYHNGDVIRECFRKLGPWIVSCHAKDLAWVPEFNVHFAEVVPGRGEIDYRAYLTELAKLPVDAPLMLEHLHSPQEYDEGRSYIQKIAGELGLSFG
ncbi:MAG TPA: TIM barrel protein [Bryobacterales bacterium]|nr:TIM barrel protein [Bryobacterales bacterium]